MYCRFAVTAQQPYQHTVEPYQHCIISSYIALGQPGGGGSLYPVAIFSMYYRDKDNNNKTNHISDIPLYHQVPQMVYAPGSTLHTLHNQNSTHHFLLNIS